MTARFKVPSVLRDSSAYACSDGVKYRLGIVVVELEVEAPKFESERVKILLER